MAAKHVLDSFSATLMDDDRILTARERTLLTSILRHVRQTTNANSEIRDSVKQVIASAVGETVAQRAFAVLGGSIVEHIVATDQPDISEETISIPPQPVLRPGPGPVPQPPGVVRPTPPKSSPGPVPQPPGMPKPGPGPVPQPPGVPKPGPGPVPQPPGHGFQPEHVRMNARMESPIEGGLAVAERPQAIRAKCVVLDEFLAPQELEELTSYVLGHESNFTASEVISPSGGALDYEHRRSHVLMDTGRFETLLLERMKAVLPSVLRQLGMEEFQITRTEFQVTASNDGDFFRMHADNSHQEIASRYLTFVYFFHREPKQFTGGELRIHDSQWETDQYVSSGTYQTIVPQQNQIVFFPCELMHEITPVKCPSGEFADSRFTLNGWLHR